MASITVNTNGQTLTVNASISHWTSAALAVVASGDDDIPSTATTTITSNYTMHFANTATTVTITVKQIDGSTLLSQTFEVNPGIGARTLNPLPTVAQLAEHDALPHALQASAAKVETLSRLLVNTNGSVLATGRLSMVAIALPAGLTITSITFLSGATALSAGSNQWFALFNSSRVLLRQTTDDTSTAWSASSTKTLALSSTFTTTYSGLHYLGINVTASTPPTLESGLSIAPASGLAPILCGTSNTSLTDTAPATADAIIAGTLVPYAYVA